MSADVGTLLQHKIAQLQQENEMNEQEDRAFKFVTLLRSYNVPETGISSIHTKYVALFTEYKKLTKDHQKQKKKLDTVAKEKEEYRQKHNSLLSQKTKLENVARELQKESRKVKEESQRLVKEEQQKREELCRKFEATLLEIKDKIELENVKRKKTQADYFALKEKFKHFMEQYTVREKHFSSVVKTKDLELQLLSSKLSHTQSMHNNTTAAHASLQKSYQALESSERELKEQLDNYIEKFQQVEETLAKSNDLFCTFRKEMEEMTRNTKRLEKENSVLRLKIEALEGLPSKTIETYNSHKAKLESLCRALQQERNEVLVKYNLLESRLKTHFGDMAVQALLEADDFNFLVENIEEEEVLEEEGEEDETGDVQVNGDTGKLCIKDLGIKTTM